jgi:hypothetical protein
MEIILALVLALIPATAILYPLLRGLGTDEFAEDESSQTAEFVRRWEAALDGLRNAELESALGNLGEEDYRWLRRQYMVEAALVLKGMELESAQEREFMEQVEHEVRRVRERALGRSGGPSETSGG